MKWPELERTTIVAVAGLGRCGTSLLMQMLDAGGMPVCGSFPDYEPQILHCPGSNDWSRAATGRAVKMLDPHRLIPPRRDYRILWLDRDLDEQASSQLKLLARSGMGQNNRKAQRGMKARLQQERAQARAMLAARSPYRLDLRFEELIERPLMTARLLEITLGRDLDWQAMADQVRPRSAACLNYMLEETLIAEGQLKKRIHANV